jgi:hypothetical protein
MNITIWKQFKVMQQNVSNRGNLLSAKMVQSEIVRVCKVAISYHIRSNIANLGGVYAHPQACVASPLGVCMAT